MIHILLGPADFDNRISDRDNCIFWQDDLTLGPVPLTQSLEDLTNIREFFRRSYRTETIMTAKDEEIAAEENGEQTSLNRASFAKRDEQLRQLDGAVEIVAWCGRNRREILMLCAVLNFAPPELLRNSKLMIAPCPTWGPFVCKPDELEQIFRARFPISHEFQEFLQQIWNGYTASDPGRLVAASKHALNQNGAIGRVLLWILEEYPSLENGLSRTEEDLLRYADEDNSIARIVGKSIGLSNDQIGDVDLYARIWNFLSCDQPLLELTTSGVSLADIDSMHALRQLAVRPSSFGRQLLKGKADYVHVNGLDRWIGGVHMCGKSVPWRFNRQTETLICI